MRFEETRLKGAFVVDPDRFEDERGFFARAFLRDEFEAHGLDPRVEQASISSNKTQGTLRGMHFQVAPHAQAKLVRCTRGAIYDVIVDLRPGSPTLRSWLGLELTPPSLRALYVPAGFAHGFQTLEPDTEVLYFISTPYQPGSEKGVRWDDPAIGIEWPMLPTVLSERDRSFPLLQAD